MLRSAQPHSRAKENAQNRRSPVSMRREAEKSSPGSLDRNEEVAVAAQFSLSEIAERIRAEPMYRNRLTWCFEFFRGIGDEDADVAALIADEPAGTGDQRFDAFLAAAAEHVAFHHQLAPPSWCYEPSRVLPFGWHMADYPQARRWAYARTPAAFMGRGIYIEERELTNV